MAIWKWKWKWKWKVKWKGKWKRERNEKGMRKE